MSLSRYEMETQINFNREDDYAELYTADSIWINKMDKLMEKNGTDFEMIEENRVNGKIISKEYKFPKRFITIRSKDKHMNFSDEELAKRVKRLPHSSTDGEHEDK